MDKQRLTLSIDSERPDEYWGVALMALRRVLGCNGIDASLHYTWGIRDALQAVGSGTVDVGCNLKEMLTWARDGSWTVQSPNLRGLARIVAPRYIGVAATASSGIESLEQVARERKPIRLATISAIKNNQPGQSYVVGRILELSGFTQTDIVSWGGQVVTGSQALAAVTDGAVDLLAGWALPNWAPDWGPIWMHAQIRSDLHFLPIPRQILDTLSAEVGVRQGVMPRLLFRGLTEDLPTIIYPDHVINTHAGMSDNLAYQIVCAIDEHSEVFRDCYTPFAFDPRHAWKDLGAPIHPGAERYYRDAGHMPPVTSTKQPSDRHARKGE